MPVATHLDCVLRIIEERVRNTVRVYLFAEVSMGRFGRNRPSVRRQCNYTAILAEHAQRDAYQFGKAQVESRMLTVDSPDPRDPGELTALACEKLKGAA
jgi:hypothetical protein